MRRGEPALSALAALSRELGVWHLVGSLTLMSDDGRMFNRSLLISDRRAVVATYDKIHMFDATLPSGTVITESSAYRPGERAVVAATPWGGLGMTVCYDLRFPAALPRAGPARRRHAGDTVLVPARDRQGPLARRCCGHGRSRTQAS